jgi:hypothetical protein
MRKIWAVLVVAACGGTDGGDDGVDAAPTEQRMVCELFSTPPSSLTIVTPERRCIFSTDGLDYAGKVAGLSPSVELPTGVGIAEPNGDGRWHINAVEWSGDIGRYGEAITVQDPNPDDAVCVWRRCDSVE